MLLGKTSLLTYQIFFFNVDGYSFSSSSSYFSFFLHSKTSVHFSFSCYCTHDDDDDDDDDDDVDDNDDDDDDDDDDDATQRNDMHVSVGRNSSLLLGRVLLRAAGPEGSLTPYGQRRSCQPSSSGQSRCVKSREREKKRIGKYCSICTTITHFSSAPIFFLPMQKKIMLC